MLTVRYCLHGVVFALPFTVPGWPRAQSYDGTEWQVLIDDVGDALHGHVRSGPARCQWLGDPVAGIGVSELLLTGGPGTGSATMFGIDWDTRRIEVAFTHSDSGGLAGSLQLLARWVVPMIARAQRRAVPLHATSVVVGGRALVLAGDSGTGKSTLTMGLIGAGARLMGDEPVVIEPTPGGLLVWPGEAHLRLRTDSQLVGRRVPSLVYEGVHLGKAHMRAADPTTEDHAIPLQAVCLLTRAAKDAPSPAAVALTPGQAMARLMDLRYSSADLPAVVKTDFVSVSVLAASGRVLELRLPEGVEQLIASCRRLPELIAGATA